MGSESGKALLAGIRDDRPKMIGLKLMHVHHFLGCTWREEAMAKSSR